MAVLPEEIPTGTVTGQFYFVNEDNIDAGTDPELTVVSGKVTFVCEATEPLRMPTKKAIIIPMEFDAEFDSQGRLVPAGRTDIGIELPASNSPLFNPTDFTWKVTFDLIDVATQYTIQIPSFSIVVPEGVVSDIVDLMPVSVAPGTIMVQGPQGEPGIMTSMNDTDVASLINTPGSQTDVALSATYGPIDDMPHKGLDIWDGFNFDGGSGSWSARTYTNWIAGIDAMLSGEIASGAVVKTDRGAGADTKRIYSYTAGEGTRNVLLLGGTHGIEWHGNVMPMRWFQSFVKSNDPTMVALRRALRVIYIPTVTPSGYLTSRRNSNSVDINRNYGYFHGAYVPPDVNYAKGAAGFDQPESTLIKNIVDAEDIRCLIDCHASDNTGETIQFVAPSPWTLGDRALAYEANAVWEGVYGNNGQYTGGSLGAGQGGEPMTHNWASYYGRWIKGRQDMAAVCIECRFDIAGVTTGEVIPREAVRLYNGWLTTYVLTWLRNGAKAVQPYPWTVMAERTSDFLVNSATAVPVSFTAISPAVTATGDHVKAVHPYPGAWHIYCTGYVESGGAAELLVFGIGENGVLNIDAKIGSVTTSAVSGQRTAITCSGRITGTPDAATIKQIGFLIYNGAGAAGLAKIKRVRMVMQYMPTSAYEVYPVPALQ